MAVNASVLDANRLIPISGWSIKRALFKAFCWAIDGVLAFSIPLIAFDAALHQLGVSKRFRYPAISLATGITHQIIFHAFERFQTLTTKRALPVYRGNWWWNFFVLDHVAIELTSFIVVGGIQALFALWPIENTALSTSMLMLLEPITFFIWALTEDLTNKYILRRQSKLEDHEQVQMGNWKRLGVSFRWSLERLLKRELWLYNLSSVMIKIGSTCYTYWVGDVLLFELAGVTSLNEATPELRALVAFLKTVIFFETFLFIGMRIPDATIEDFTAEFQNPKAADPNNALDNT